MNPVERAVRRVDTAQQRHAATAFTFAVVKKFGDDRGSALAALLAYYGFLAVFPLLLLLVTILGYVLAGNPTLQHHVLHSAVGEFPVVGNQLAGNVRSLRGRGLGLVIGAVGLLWGSLGFAQTAQLAMAEVWNVPGVIRPNYWSRLARSLLFVVLLGLAVIASTALSGVGTGGHLGRLVTAAFVLASTAINIGVFTASFRILTPAEVPVGDLWPGACLAAIAWELLQGFGGYLVGHQLRHMSQVYGAFAVVLGLISFLFLGSEIVLYAAELNVVRSRRLWPRGIVQPPLTAADRRVLTDVALEGERRPEQTVTVQFRQPAVPPAGR